LRLLVSALWLRRAMLGCSRRSTPWWAARLTIGALPSLSRAARFARRTARRRRTTRLTHFRRRPTLKPATLICTRTRCWRRRTESLRCRTPAPTLWRNIFRSTSRTRTRTLAECASWRPAMFWRWRRRAERGRCCCARCSHRAGCCPREWRPPACSSFAAFKWRRRQGCWSRRRCRRSELPPCPGRWFPTLDRWRTARWSCCRARKHTPGFTSRAGRDRRLPPGRTRWTLANSRWRAAGRSRSRTSWRRNVPRIFSLNLLFEFRLIRKTGPTALDLWLCNFGLHGRRLHRRRRLGDPGGCSHYKFVPLHFRERSGFSRGGQISRRLPLHCEPLNRPGRI